MRGYNHDFPKNGRQIFSTNGLDIIFDNQKSICPTGKIIFAAAWAAAPRCRLSTSANAIVHNGVLDPGKQLLSKPFAIEDLGKKIRSILDGFS